MKEYLQILEENELKKSTFNLPEFSTILGELKMLDELKSNEETVLEAWNLIWSPGDETVKESKVREFLLKVHNSSNVSKASIYK